MNMYTGTTLFQSFYNSKFKPLLLLLLLPFPLLELLSNGSSFWFSSSGIYACLLWGGAGGKSDDE